MARMAVKETKRVKTKMAETKMAETKMAETKMAEIKMVEVDQAKRGILESRTSEPQQGGP